MDLLIETVLRNAVTSRTDLFGEDCSFVRFEMGDVNWRGFAGVQSSLRFGRIVYLRKNRNETEYSNDLVLKLTPSTVLMKDFSTLQFFNEALFYTRMLPFFETFDGEIGRTLFPRYYNSLLQYNANSDEAVILFENLRSSGYFPTAKKSFLDYDHLRLMMRKLGQFHAYSYRARAETPRRLRGLILCQLETNDQYFDVFPCLKDCQTRGLEPLTSDPLYSSRIENLRHLIAECDDVFRRSLLAGDESNPAHVVCHGDYTGNNVLFAYEKGTPTDLKMIDLANWRFASPAIDLAMVLYLNADQEMRNENWDNLLDEYYAAVRATFRQTGVPSKDCILAEFKTEATVMVYFLASFFLPSMIARDNRDVPSQADLVPPEYEDILFGFLPPDLRNLVFAKVGGEKATLALSNILKDMVDRGFV